MHGNFPNFGNSLDTSISLQTFPRGILLPHRNNKPLVLVGRGENLNTWRKLFVVTAEPLENQLNATSSVSDTGQ